MPGDPAIHELYEQATYSVQTLQASLTRTKGFISILERSRRALGLSELDIKSLAILSYAYRKQNDHSLIQSRSTRCGTSWLRSRNGSDIMWRIVAVQARRPAAFSSAASTQQMRRAASNGSRSACDATCCFDHGLEPVSSLVLGREAQQEVQSAAAYVQTVVAIHKGNAARDLGLYIHHQAAASRASHPVSHVVTISKEAQRFLTVTRSISLVLALRSTQASVSQCAKHTSRTRHHVKRQ